MTEYAIVEWCQDCRFYQPDKPRDPAGKIRPGTGYCTKREVPQEDRGSCTQYEKLEE